MEAIRHITEAALTDDPEETKAEIEAAHKQLVRMCKKIEKQERERALEEQT